MAEDGTIIKSLSLNGVSVSVPKHCDESLDHARLVLSRWDTFIDIISSRCGGKVVPLDGESLDVASVTAVAR